MAPVPIGELTRRMYDTSTPDSVPNLESRRQLRDFFCPIKEVTLCAPASSNLFNPNVKH